MGASRSSEEVRVVKFQGVGLDINFWAKSLLRSFSSCKSSHKIASWFALVRSEIQWWMGGAGLVAMVAFKVVVFNAVVRFQIWWLSVGDEQTKQVCLAHGFCMAQRMELESAGNELVRQDCLGTSR